MRGRFWDALANGDQKYTARQRGQPSRERRGAAPAESTPSVPQSQQGQQEHEQKHGQADGRGGHRDP